MMNLLLSLFSTLSLLAINQARSSGQDRFFCWPRPFLQWGQIGEDIVGAAANVSSGYSVAMSADGNRIAVGAPEHHCSEGVECGLVRVYDWTGSAWQQLGEAWVGNVTLGHLGRFVAMSADGSRVAMGTFDGFVFVYEWNGSTWDKLGSTLWPVEFSMAMSADGLKVVTGTRGDPLDTGKVRVYDFDSSIMNDWVQMGQDQSAEAYLGSSVALSANGSRLAAGATEDSRPNLAFVRVYDWNGTGWAQAGNDLYGDAVFDYFGSSVDLSSDGSRLAVGAPTHSGLARVFEWVEDNSEWAQLGHDIDGEAPGDRLGGKVVLSADGNRLFVGAIYNDGNGSSSGHVRVFDWTGSTWSKIGQDIDGKAAEDYFGGSIAVSSDGTRIAVGTGYNDGPNVMESGYARVYEAVWVDP